MRSILLVKTSSLGDVIHNLPVVSDLRRHWPALAIDWVVEESFAEIPRLHPGVRHVLPVAVRRWRKALTRRDTWHEIGQFQRQLRETCYDLVIDTQGLVKSALITRLADGLRCGYDRTVAREPLAARFYDCHYAIPGTAHAVERNRWLVAAACGYAPDLPLRYGIHANPDAGASPYCVLLTATSRDDKLWPETHWQALGQTLAAQGLRSLLPAGSPRERERATRIASAIPGAETLPPSSLTALAGILAGAQSVVGVDTGLTHLAAALDRPVVALYVATDPGLTGVHAGPRAVNLGGRGQCPAPAEVLNALQALPG
ncbi:MAG: lipopolysaccharide heptosyltransferase I [Candidatus Dactylopiibacterium carminicum]|uniref:Lipopolysaccharide heptosyltransferase 1 n=1 Tax=Candidatus Dactylopiibacterium carminicum TaxID=857335 RepID=A0A272EN83_9RHOO|nr:lipopolysaccharide heptosyltransferase I [Candidatus Dactylopiibacterium carminicum]KAF7597942.1 lipopolysaccharide heptosyltransferase I [Candidatus Dactylopiibacterium carminicum]PAS91516.1 MAG: lipopolysaccharide heptosyltransferase I [Candidatus Dactylopiibacterium carminicum]PAS93063.1 MAG: lipopolysaccharide heptosyltransferase I [Candidatus Dactylopiibacterium carminicum]PAS96066.1 MAG: lipopolysaccharide heptosyltransferase I [Candidatus Dactylopiibacterium carminicum]